MRYQWRRGVDIAILRANFPYQMKSNFLIGRGNRLFLFGIVFLNGLYSNPLVAAPDVSLGAKLITTGGQCGG